MKSNLVIGKIETLTNIPQLPISNYILGIDPGVSGGIAIVSSTDSQAIPMPQTEKDIFNAIESFVPLVHKAYIEKVSSMPKQGVKSVWTFSGNYHGLRMALIANKIPFEAVSPYAWQKSLKCLSKGDKNITKAKAQQLFPEIKITHKLADALLIAEYGRRIESE